MAVTSQSVVLNACEVDTLQRPHHTAVRDPPGLANSDAPISYLVSRSLKPANLATRINQRTPRERWIVGVSDFSIVSERAQHRLDIDLIVGTAMRQKICRLQSAHLTRPKRIVTLGSQSSIDAIADYSRSDIDSGTRIGPKIIATGGAHFIRRVEAER